ncbi:sensor histidine kinase [Thermoflexibacter ruber]|uniref:Histidine kinase n=1 Tax=Thermoflexibacter ruber TaxID=1003 RepID=A0A1I2C645_9BACT|nr:histidine kinase [Thermoflexibacter ruber]SFE63313.1 Histidine kinase [Thermoflexibacter ruber]
MEKVTLNDQKARWIGTPLITIGLALYIHPEAFFPTVDWFEAWHWLSTSFLNTFFVWEGCRYIFIRSRVLYPNYSQTKKRLFYEAVVIIVYIFIITSIIDYGYCYLLLGKDLPVLFKGFKIGLIPTTIVTLIYESVFFFESWAADVKKSEILARENVQSQLDTLKNQLDPHFLFNSLNTLASLIDDENKPAQEYLDRLSDVYRYVLISKDKNTVTVEEEMQFLDAYIYLNKVRFRENLQIEKQVSRQTYHQQVAPLSLQMLIENAIKHNIISKDKPLKIKISEDGEGYLQVENNIQEKKTFEKSTKVGLQNIVNRYQLLSDRQVEIVKNNDFFKVKIPLLQ